MRSIRTTIATSKDGFTLTIKETETVTEETGETHTESESSSGEFAQYKTALEAAHATLKRFEQKLAAADGELFG